MNFDEFQDRARETEIYRAKCARQNVEPYFYSALGLADECGETLGKIKKSIRDGDGMTEEVRMAVAKELGDVLWYVAMLAGDLHLKLSAIAELNGEKLADRKARGVLGGSGDAR